MDMDEAKALPQAEVTETTTQEPQEKVPKEGLQEKKLILYAVIAVVVILVLVIGGIVLMARHPQATATVRDIAIVFVAVMTFFIGVAVLVLLVQLTILVKVLREEIAPMMAALQETLATVRGTTAFVSESVVSPVVKAASFAAGVKRVAGNVLGFARAVKRGQSKSATGGKNDVQE